MLLSYSINVTKENWLHESLVKIIHTIHQKLDSASPVPSWANLLPAGLTTPQTHELKARHGLKKRVKQYETTVTPLTTADRTKILQVLNEQNDIPGLVAGTSTISSLLPQYPEVHLHVSNLFKFAYEMLTELGVRDRQYNAIFASLEIKFCPFCGFDRLMSPEEARQDQDHYLAKSIYPFAAANMRNLVPMCRCCNRDYKHDTDTLKDINKQRRRAYDPYNAPGVDISLVNSLPFQGVKLMPAWWIDFIPATQESDTWDQIFCIKTRYSREVLNLNYERWLRGFMKRCLDQKHPKNLTDNQILEILKRHYDDIILDPPTGVDFLKPKVFEMFISHFGSGNARVISFIRDLVVGV